MEFVESINYQSHSPSYRLAHGISVRGEKFGLLFYNSKGPKLIFVRSGQWIHPIFFSRKKWDGSIGLNGQRSTSGLLNCRKEGRTSPLSLKCHEPIDKKESETDN